MQTVDNQAKNILLEFCSLTKNENYMDNLNIRDYLAIRLQASNEIRENLVRERCPVNEKKEVRHEEHEDKIIEKHIESNCNSEDEEMDELLLLNSLKED